MRGFVGRMNFNPAELDEIQKFLDGMGIRPTEVSFKNVQPQAGQWYRITPVKSICELAQGVYKIVKVKGNAFFYEGGIGAGGNAIDCYRFDLMPQLDEILSQIDAGIGRSGRGQQKPKTKRTPQVKNIVESRSGMYFLRLKFVPTEYSAPDAKRVVVERFINTKRFRDKNALAMSVIDTVAGFTHEHGHGEYFVTGGISSTFDAKDACRIRDQMVVFSVPRNKDLDWWLTKIPKDKNYKRFLSEFKKYIFIPYVDLDSDRRVQWCICDITSGKYLCRNGLLHDMSDRSVWLASQNTVNFKDEAEARLFLVSWLNQGKKPCSEWVVRSYNVRVAGASGDQYESNLIGLDYYDVMYTVAKRHPDCSTVVVWEVAIEKENG